MLRKQIIQDKWKKAIHSVIARWGITEALAEQKRAAEEQKREMEAGEGDGDSFGDFPASSQLQVRWDLQGNGANTSAGGWQHWQQGLGMGALPNMQPMQPHIMQPVFRPSVMHMGTLTILLYSSHATIQKLRFPQRPVVSAMLVFTQWREGAIAAIVSSIRMLHSQYNLHAYTDPPAYSFMCHHVLAYNHRPTWWCRRC